MLRHYYIQNVKGGIQIRVYSYLYGAYKINEESVIHFSQFISIKVKNILRKSHAQFQGSYEN